MRDGHKIDKAKEALKKALGELRRTDTFNIIIFKRDASTFRDDSVPATLVNVANAKAFIDDIRIGDGTNISRAMDLALGMNGLTHIYLMSDGEPNGGIADFGELRRFVRERNTHNIKIMTLALGLGENFPGMRLLKGIADDNSGSYDYINLARVSTP
jgi:Ca-activated chloride channel family protein